MKFLIFKLENPLSCSHHSMQIRAILAKNGVLGTTFDELEWVYPFRLELQKFSVAYFFSHFLRFHFIAKHHEIKITQIKKKLSFQLRMKINWKGHRLSSTNQALEKLNLRRKMSICVRVFFSVLESIFVRMKSLISLFRGKLLANQINQPINNVQSQFNFQITLEDIYCSLPIEMIDSDCGVTINGI